MPSLKLTIVYGVLALAFALIVRLAVWYSHRNARTTKDFETTSKQFFFRVLGILTLVVTAILMFAYWQVVEKREHRKNLKHRKSAPTYFDSIVVEAASKEEIEDLKKQVQEQHDHIDFLNQEKNAAYQLRLPPDGSSPDAGVFYIPPPRRRVVQAMGAPSMKAPRRRLAPRRVPRKRLTQKVIVTSETRIVFQRRYNRKICAKGWVLVVDLDTKRVKCLKPGTRGIPNPKGLTAWVPDKDDYTPINPPSMRPSPQPMRQGFVFAISDFEEVLNHLAPLIYFLFLALGVLSKYYWDYSVKKEGGEDVRFGSNKLILSFIVALLVYFTIQGILEKEADKISVRGILFAYYNGFVWQTLLTEIADGVAKARGSTSTNEPNPNEPTTPPVENNQSE